MARTFTLPVPVSAFTGTRNVTNPAALVSKSLNLTYRSGWAFDDSTQEGISTHCFIFPDEYTGTGTLKAELQFSAAGSTGSAGWAVYCEAITPGDTLNLTTSESWDSANSATKALSGTTAGDDLTCTVTLANKDSAASGDLFRLAIIRDTAGGDDASGDLTLWAVSLYEES
tara:strand:+ start:5092 stop:5604 length:513 start_codon:yes stop_codon:yes gene_type:complete